MPPQSPRLQRASQNSILPCLHGGTFASSLQTFIPLYGGTSTSLRLQRAYNPPELHASIPPRHYMYSSPPELKLPRLPSLHLQRASRPPYLHASMSLHLERPPKLQTSISLLLHRSSGARTPRLITSTSPGQQLASRPPCLHVATPA